MHLVELEGKKFCSTVVKNFELKRLDSTALSFSLLFQIIDQGAVLHKGSYLRDWWNVIDTTVVACNIAATVLT